MADKPVVAVVGATGAQGQGVLTALLHQGKYRVRGLTRNTSADKARALAAQGVEVVRGDLSDKASLLEAFQGAYAVFLMTDSISVGFKPEAELQQGKAAVDAAKEAGAQFIVWSGLEDTRKALPANHGLKELAPGYIVPHLDAKAEVTDYIANCGVPYSVILTSIFYINWSRSIQYQPQGDGSYAFTMTVSPDTKVAVHDENDIGATLAAILNEPAKYAGATVPVVREYLSMNEVAQILSDVTGNTVHYHNMPSEQFAALPFPGAPEAANMWAYWETPALLQHRPLDKALAKA